ncbi:hypothetical protein GCM10007898_30420 [Dyella flagellata]|uniref:3'-5' exonuclease domain-containing protein n=1 Tax=Dyella flagellata TaxID=1867833 RepID=A0ABQ5XE20_9GAMM|nr:hypothetical protein GCM10007898_30420 [Dyella flagellata]
MALERYKPVALDVETTRKRWRKKPAFAAAYDAMADKFAALAELARASAGRADAGGRGGTYGRGTSLSGAAGSQCRQPQTCALDGYTKALCRCRRLRIAHHVDHQAKSVEVNRIQIQNQLIICTNE